MDVPCGVSGNWGMPVFSDCPNPRPEIKKEEAGQGGRRMVSAQPAFGGFPTDINGSGRRSAQ